jgi:integrase
LTSAVHPHCFRHTHASELAGERLPLGAILAQLGHTSIATTSLYVAKLTASDLAEQMAAVG